MKKLFVCFCAALLLSGVAISQTPGSTAQDTTKAGTQDTTKVGAAVDTQAAEKENEARAIKRIAFDLAFQNYQLRTGSQRDVYDFSFQLYIDNLRLQEERKNVSAGFRVIISDLKKLKDPKVEKALKKYGL